MVTFVFVLIACGLSVVQTMHIKGEFNTNDFYKYLTRFGFKATDIHNVQRTQGFIYGNVTHKYDSTLSNRSLTLIILDKKSFYEFHKKHTILPRQYACQMMFNERLTMNLFNLNCNLNGTLDYTRRVPCTRNDVCTDHQNNSASPAKLASPINNYQFTIKLNYINEAQFFYVSLVACDLDKDYCQWTNSFGDSGDTVDYSIYLTNGKNLN
jgi:hypothetical protein